MSSTQVTVLCPNARRQLVKTTPNLKILSIIEEVCKKQGYEASEYDLIHQRRPLDVTLTLRLAGVPNNGQLELKKCEAGPRRFEEVTIALQLEDGSRLPANTFKPETSTLRDLLEANRKDLADMAHFLDEQSATGSHPTVTYLNEQVVGLFQLANTTLKELGLTSGRFIVRFSMKAVDEEAMQQSNEQFKQKLEKKAKLEDIFKQKQQEREQQPDEAPVQPSQSQDYGVTRKPRQELEYLHEPAREAPEQAVVRARGGSRENRLDPPLVRANEFANFKFPEHSKGQTLNDLNELADMERLSKEPCDRQAILFNNERSRTDQASTDDSMTTDLPDEFFEVNVADIHNMLSDLKRVQNDEAPLMTKKLRELEQDKRAMKYSQIVVRVAFKDGLILQGLFRPKEKVSALYEFVSESLAASNAQDDLDFHLYITPPKKVLADQKRTLFEEHLYPASIVYFKNKSEQTPAFKEHVSMRTLGEADEIVMKHVHGAMRNVEHEGMDQLIRQERVLSNVLHSSGLASSSSSAQQSQQARAPSSSSSASSGGDVVTKKLSKFLGKK